MTEGVDLLEPLKNVMFVVFGKDPLQFVVPLVVKGYDTTYVEFAGSCTDEKLEAINASSPIVTAGPG